MAFAVFRPDVADDLQQAVDWYNEKLSGLGKEFLSEFWEKMGSICENPESFALFDADIRSARIARFPYLIHYRYDHHQEQLIVLAVMFAGRDESAWISRAK